MASEVKFYLERRKDKETGQVIIENAPIFMFYSFSGQRLQYFTGQRIDSAKWDTEAMKAKKGYEESAEINRELSQLKAKVEDIHNKANALSEELTLEEFRLRIKGTQKKAKNKKSFQECLEEYYKSSELKKTDGTMRALKSSFNIFDTFSKSAKIPMEFKNITMEFYDKFLDYCFNTADYKNGYTGKLIKDLKAFMNWATEEGYNSNLEFRKKAFKKLTEEPEIIYLTYEELMKLYKHDFKANARLDQVRDVFCFACFTGMRYSDVLALAPEHVHKDFINYRIVKTTVSNTIPLNPFSKAILKKYKGKLGARCLPVISEQKTNDYLEDVFKDVKLKRMVQQINFQGPKVIKSTAPLHKVVTYHISKKTFMTNFLAKGGSLLTAMSITGNKDLKTARRYYKVVDTLKADEMARVFGK